MSDYYDGSTFEKVCHGDIAWVLAQGVGDSTQPVIHHWLHLQLENTL